jgi:hypothetical protein
MTAILNQFGSSRGAAAQVGSRPQIDRVAEGEFCGRRFEAAMREAIEVRRGTETIRPPARLKRYDEWNIIFFLAI